MLLTLASSLAFSAAISLSMSCVRVLVGWPSPGMIVPLPRSDPEDCAVPTVLVPGGLGSTLSLPGVGREGVVLVELAIPEVEVASEGAAALPTPLGSLPELFSPAAFAGPLGTRLTPSVPAPADPADGEEPADEPLLEAPPLLPPPLPPPPPPPP
jgi:hypothetical protein